MGGHGSFDKTWQMCGVCGYPLVRLSEVDGSAVRGWAHLRADELADHVAVPVDAAEVRFNQRCDFCDSAPVVDVVLAEDFTLPGGVNRSAGGWTACEPCGLLLRRRAWSQLATRVKHTLPSAKYLSRGHLLELYTRLAVHLVDVVPVDVWRAQHFGPADQ